MLGQDAFIRGAELHHQLFLFVVCHKGDVHTLSSFMYAFEILLFRGHRFVIFISGTRRPHSRPAIWWQANAAPW